MCSDSFDVLLLVLELVHSYSLVRRPKDSKPLLDKQLDWTTLNPLDVVGDLVHNISSDKYESDEKKEYVLSSLLPTILQLQAEFILRVHEIEHTFTVQYN